MGTGHMRGHGYRAWASAEIPRICMGMIENCTMDVGTKRVHSAFQSSVALATYLAIASPTVRGESVALSMTSLHV